MLCESCGKEAKKLYKISITDDCSHIDMVYVRSVCKKCKNVFLTFFLSMIGGKDGNRK